MLNTIFKRLALFICLVSVTAFAQTKQENILWATPEWQDITDGSGLFDEVMQAVFENSPYRIEKRIVPWKRALRLVASGSADMTGGEDLNPSHLQSEMPIQLLEESVLFRKSAINWLGVASLRKIQGIWPIGYIDTFPHEYKQYLSGMGVSQRDQSINLILKTDRPVYYLDNKYHIERLLTNNDEALKADEFAIKKLFDVPVYWRFANNERGKAIKAFFDQRMSQLLCAGELDEIYRRYNSPLADKAMYCG